RVFQLRMQTERSGAPLRSTGVSMLGSLYHGPREASNSDRILDGQARARKRAASVPIPAAATGPVLGPLVCMESGYPEDRNRMVDMQRQYRSARALGSLLFLLVSSLSAIYAQQDDLVGALIQRMAREEHGGVFDAGHLLRPGGVRELEAL